MRQQRMEMMQSNAAARSPMPRRASAAEQPESADMPSAPEIGDMAARQAACAKMHRGWRYADAGMGMASSA